MKKAAISDQQLATRHITTKYIVELDEKRVIGCRMSRAFPWVVKDGDGKVLQFAKTAEDACRWIQRNHEREWGNA
jgi:hypothetical protein